ncbi:MAG: acetate--CoA ligase family protein [Desulfurococcaceae archaeon]
MMPRKIIENALNENRTKLLEHEAFEIAKYYGIPTPNAVLVKTPEEAYDLADKIGYPLVLKIVSPDITHKSDVGGVKLGLKNKEEVSEAVKEMLKTVQSRAPNARIAGIVMYKMAPPGLEVIVGGVRDDVFGAVVMFGLGGIFVEVLRDVSFRISPVSLDDALEMINEIKSATILNGFRGQPPADKHAIADIIVKTSKLLMENQEIESIDLNPVIAYSQGALAVDVRIVLKRGNK